MEEEEEEEDEETADTGSRTEEEEEDNEEPDIALDAELDAKEGDRDSLVGRGERRDDSVLGGLSRLRRILLLLLEPATSEASRIKIGVA